MGIKITKETLEKIYKDYEANKSKIPKNKSKGGNLNTINNMLKKNFINKKNINEKNKKISEKYKIKDENKIIIEENEITDDEINDILFRRHKSFELINKKENEEELNINNIINNNNQNISLNDNSSVNSDYLDISNQPILLNKTKKQNNSKLKSIRLRNSYYTKLICSNILTFQKEPKVTNLFFFDWDDTLICTSYLAPTGVLDETDSKSVDKNIIKNLDQLVATLLTKTIEKGQVFIVTNAAHGWIEYSSKKLYPITSKLLKQIKIVSARGLYEKRLPGDYRQWKTRAFIDTILNSNIDMKKTANILCFGDSIIELEATHKLKEIFANAYIKTVKFKESPQPVELIKELKIIISQFDIILSNIKNLSIKVAKKKNE